MESPDQSISLIGDYDWDLCDIRITAPGVTGIDDAAERGQSLMRGMRSMPGRTFDPPFGFGISGSKAVSTGKPESCPHYPGISDTHIIKDTQ